MKSVVYNVIYFFVVYFMIYLSLRFIAYSDLFPINDSVVVDIVEFLQFPIAISP